MNRTYWRFLRVFVWGLVSCGMVAALARRTEAMDADAGSVDAHSDVRLVDAGALDAAVDAGPRGRIEITGIAASESGNSVAVNVAASTDAFDYRLRLEEVEGREVEEVALSVTPLVDARGQQHAFKWGVDPAQLDERDRRVVVPRLAPFGVVSIILRASLPDLGSYTGSLAVYWGGARRQKIALTVTRARGALNLEIPEAPALLPSEKAVFSMSVRETEDRQVQIEVPTLTSLVEMRGTDPKKLFTNGNLKVSMDGQTPDAGALITISPRGVRRFDFELENLPPAGHFDASIRFASRDAPPIDRLISVYKRAAVWVPLLFIALGVLASWGLRYWVMDEQPRLAQQQQALGLMQELDENLRISNIDEDGRDLVRTVRVELRQLLAALMGPVGTKEKQRVEAMLIKVPLVRNWLLLGRSLRTVTDVSVRRTYEKELAEMRRHLVGHDTSTEDLKKDGVRMRALPAEIGMAVEKSLRTRAEAFERDLTAAAETVGVGDSVRGTLQGILVSFRASGGGTSASEDALVGAQRVYLEALVRELRTKLNVKPGYLEDVDWRSVREAVEGVLTLVIREEPAQGLATYRIAYKEYLQRINAALKAKAEKIGESLNLSDDKRRPLDELYEAAEKALKEDKFAEAAEKIGLLQKEVPKLESGGVQMGRSQPPIMTVQTVGGILRAFTATSRFDVPSLANVETRTVERVKRGVLFELFVNAVVLIVAVVLGLKVLYFADLTWGGWEACITAMLWGLGLHQFTYGGVGGVFDRLTKAPSAAGGS